MRFAAALHPKRQYFGHDIMVLYDNFEDLNAAFGRHSHPQMKRGMKAGVEEAVKIYVGSFTTSKKEKALQLLMMEI